MPNWELARRVASAQDWLITAAQARQCGVTPTDLAGALRRGSLRRLLHGVYLLDPEMYDDLPIRAMLRAALLAHGPNACLVGRSAARAWELEGLPWEDPAVEVAVVGGISRQRRPVREESPWMWPVVARQLPVRPEEVTAVGGLAVRAAASTVIDAGLQLDRMQALALADSALYRGRTTQPELASAVEAAKGRPGIQRLRPVLALADGRAESPLESRVRLICVDGGVAPDELQHPVRNAFGAVIAVGDFYWKRSSGRPLLGEADGRVHALPTAVYRDRRRGNALVHEAYDTVRFVYADTAAYIVDVVTRALAR